MKTRVSWGVKATLLFFVLATPIVFYGHSYFRIYLSIEFDSVWVMTDTSETGEYKSIPAFRFRSISPSDFDLWVASNHFDGKFLEFYGGSFSNWGIGLIARGMNPDYLVFHHGQLNDESMEILATQCELLSLIANGQHLTDHCFQSVAKMKSLKRLDLQGGEQLTGDGLGQLIQCQDLALLGLTNIKLSPHGWRELAKLTQVQLLHVGYWGSTRTTQEQLAAVGQMKSLEVLTLDSLANPNDLVELKALPHLRELHIRYPPERIEDLAILNDFPTLKRVQFDFDDKTQAKVKKLLPGLDVN